MDINSFGTKGYAGQSPNRGHELAITRPGFGRIAPNPNFQLQPKPNFGGPFIHGNQNVGDHLSMATEFDGDCLSRGINFMGIVCPGGQEVGDWKSGDQMGLGPNGLLLTKEQLVEYPLDSFQIC